MAGVRLPLQLGRAALNQGARFAAFVWLFPLLLILSAMLVPIVTMLGAVVLALASFVALAFTIEAADMAKRDRPSDIVLDSEGFAIEGGPLDKTRYAWSQVDAARCTIEKGEPRSAIRWLLLRWLTVGRIEAINRRARVDVHRLHLPTGKKTIELAEAEGEELESLERLRDSIRGAAAPATDGGRAALPQDVLVCPHCGAPQVPAATPTMTCGSCGHDLDVPAELQQRMRASAILDDSGGSRARVVQKLVDQPSARRAAFVIAWCRRLMVWIQPAALTLLIVFMFHQTSSHPQPGSIGIVREAPSDDGVLVYDLGLLALVVAGAFGIAWSIGHAYVANRQALRMLADNFGAVPPAKSGEPSSCRQCGAPLPATRALLVHCVYCRTENILGIDPRPAALRRKREGIGLVGALRKRRRAQLRMAIVIPLSALLAFTMIREVRLVWNVPEHSGPLSACTGRCGTITNSDPIRRTIVVANTRERVQATLLPHGKVTWSCGFFAECTIEVGGASITPDEGGPTNLQIEHGGLRQLGR